MLVAVYDFFTFIGAPAAIAWAIVFLTLLVRTIVIPLYRRQLVSQRRMQMLQPEIKEIQRRYNIKLLTAPANDHWYEYIMIEPKLATDRRHFMKARVVLSKSNYLVRQIWLLQPNHNEITWDFPRMVTGIALDRKEFAKPQLAEGWTFEETPLRAGDPKP